MYTHVVGGMTPRKYLGNHPKKTRIFGVNLNILVGVQNYAGKPEAQLSAGCGVIAGLNGLTLGIL